MSVQVPNTRSRDTQESSAHYVSPALKIAAGWSWRLLVVGIAAAALYWMFSKISLIVISIMIAALLAGLVSPVVYFLRKNKIHAGIATAITEIGLIAGVIGLLTLVGQQLTAGFSSLSDQVAEGWNQLVAMLNNLPIELGADRIDGYISQLTEAIQNNTSSIISGVASVGSTAADIGTGTVIVLFTLIFFLMEGERIWLFIVELFPRRSRLAVNGAGRRGWKVTGQLRARTGLRRGGGRRRYWSLSLLLGRAAGFPPGRPGFPGFLYSRGWCTSDRCYRGTARSGS